MQAEYQGNGRISQNPKMVVPILKCTCQKRQIKYQHDETEYNELKPSVSDCRYWLCNEKCEHKSQCG